MALMAVAYPIAPGQSGTWQAWMDELKGARRAAFVASRRDAGVRERTFLQATPMGEMVLVTLEGDDPIASFATMVSKDDEFTRWFIENANAADGMDLSQPMPEAPSTPSGRFSNDQLTAVTSSGTSYTSATARFSR